MYPRSEEEFKTFAQKGNLIPVYEEMSTSFETPLSVYLKIRQGTAGFLLESIERGKNQGRYSFIGAKTYLLFRVKDNKAVICENGKERVVSTADPFGELEKIFQRYKPVELPGLSGFTGGAVGYLGYDMVRYIENLPERKTDGLDCPDCVFLFTDSVIIFDHVRQVMQIVVNVRTTADSGRDYQQAIRKIQRFKKRLQQPAPLRESGCSTGKRVETAYRSNLTSGQYQEKVKEAKQHILAGDIFQVVLSRKLELQLESHPLDIYRSLRSVNPSPYMFYLEMEGVCLVGSSPEMMVKAAKQRAYVTPIAGTRPRGTTEMEEEKYVAELLADEKEKAEHLMLVDLGRNDLGRVCTYGSVKTASFMEVEKYSHVMHLVSTVQGELRPDCTCFDLLKACFPAGTVSGAPKVRAMEIIDSLENCSRGPYAGAVGYISYSGEMDTCITIRTMIITGEKGYIQVGAGIVADSDPEKEYQETQNKAQALIKAVEKAEKGGSYAAGH